MQVFFDFFPSASQGLTNRKHELAKLKISSQALTLITFTESITTQMLQPKLPEYSL